MGGMDGDTLARLGYLAVLVLALSGWFVMQLRGNMARSLQHVAIWGLIFLGVIAAYGLWSDIRRQVVPVQAVLADGRIEVPRGPDGHYHLVLQVNGTPIEFIVDTGATDIVLSRADAARAGLNPEGLAYLGTAMTANGPVRTAAVRLDLVELGAMQDRDLRAVVNDGAMDGSLLGMGYLHLFQKIEITGGTLILTR
jgi:aspartyl protease family protein